MSVGALGRSHILCALVAMTIGLSCADVPDGAGAPDPPSVVVGSKKFTESVILAEALALSLRRAGAEATHRAELGGTRVLWNAMRAGLIDAYPEYTGTIAQEILGGRLDDPGDGAAMSAALAAMGISMTASLGFENTYAIGMREEAAQRAGLARISDLAGRTTLRIGFTNEFMDRGDGWPSLRRKYGLDALHARGLDHDLAYKALVAGDIDVTDFYSTDPEIEHYRLRVLEDDLGHFPEYEAVVVYRSALADEHPDIVAALSRLEGAVGAETMRAMSSAVKFGRRSEREVAADLMDAVAGDGPLVETRGGAGQTGDSGLAAAGGDRATKGSHLAGAARRIREHSLEHLALVALSLSAAVAVALPLGILAAKREAVGRIVLASVGIVQTIPSLALLVFMMPLLGIGGPPAVAALFLYSLLPIVRNTHAGLHDIPHSLTESAEALGLTPTQRLVHVELPLASRAIMAGVKTSAVINVGTATLGALIGAGGYGQPILTGIRLDDLGLIAQGAVPAALMALGAQALFDGLERVIVPAGLRRVAPARPQG